MVDYLLVPALVLMGLTLAMLGWRGWQYGRRWFAELTQAPAVVLTHSINDDLCIGCDACVLVCPANVLALEHNKSRVLRFDDCIQCRKCAEVCPTSALVMYPEGEVAPPIVVPNLDEYYQSRDSRGLYLIGQAAGKPLVKNGVNLGRVAVEHMVKEGLDPHRRGSPAQPEMTPVDVLIAGSGPAGLSAALSCVEHGLSHVLLESKDGLAATIVRFPAGKLVEAQPYDVRCVGHLPVWDASRESLLAEWQRLAAAAGVVVHYQETVLAVRRLADGYAVRTPQREYHAARVILAVGGSDPKRLDVEGEDLVHVQHDLDVASKYRGTSILIVGAGDAAVEAAVALAEPSLQNRVVLCSRAKQITRPSLRNRQALQERVQKGLIHIEYGASPATFLPGAVLLKRDGKDQKKYKVDHVFVLVGASSPREWLEKQGIVYVAKEHQFKRSRTDRLLENLIGAQPAVDRAGTWPSFLSEMQSDTAAVTMFSSTRQTLHSPGRPGTMTGPTTGTLIQLAQADSRTIFRLPKKAIGEPGALTVRQLRNRQGPAAKLEP